MSKGSGAHRRLRTNFTLGEGAAEYDGLLFDAFYETSLYRTITSKNDQRCFLIGRTGSGKSATFRQLEQDYADHVIRLSPEDLSLPYIAELDVVQSLKALDVHLDPLFIALWKHVIIIEIIKRRYNVDSPDATRRFITGLMEKLRKDKSKQEALRYLEEFEGKFWSETNERVREIVHRFESQVTSEIQGKVVGGIGVLAAGGGDSTVESLEEKRELVNRFQRLVNETQLSRINRMVRVLDEDILESSQHYTYVLIDDLDRDWADERVTNDLIRCLFRAVMDLKRVQNIKVLVALRTNILEALDFGRTGGQEEKFRGLVLRVQWTEGDLVRMLDRRVQVAAARLGIEGFGSVADLLPRANQRRGDPVRHILSRTLLRPRDAISFFNECLALANGKERLTWHSINAAEASYSTNRLLALRDEWKPTFPGIDRVFEAFSRVPAVVDWKTLISRLEDCALLSADPAFPGAVWMTRLSEPIWSGSSADDDSYTFQPLIRLLHNVGFLGFIQSVKDQTSRVDVDDPAIYNYDSPDFADHLSNVRSASGFVIHPAFCPALEIPVWRSDG